MGVCCLDPLRAPALRNNVLLSPPPSPGAVRVLPGPSLCCPSADRLPREAHAWPPQALGKQERLFTQMGKCSYLGEVVSSILDGVSWDIQRHWLGFWSPEERASQETVHNMTSYSLTTLGESLSPWIRKQLWIL